MTIIEKLTCHNQPWFLYEERTLSVISRVFWANRPSEPPADGRVRKCRPSYSFVQETAVFQG